MLYLLYFRRLANHRLMWTLLNAATTNGFVNTLYFSECKADFSVNSAEQRQLYSQLLLASWPLPNEG